MDHKNEPFSVWIRREAESQLAVEERKQAVEIEKKRILSERNKKKWYHRIFPYRITIEKL